VGAGEGVQERIRVGAPLERQGGQLQPHHPTLRPAFQGGDGLHRQVELPHLTQERRRLLRGEAKVGGAQLDQLAAGPQPCHRQGRVAPAGDGQVQPRRRMAQQKPQAVMDHRFLDHVVVVENQRHLVGRGLEPVDQGGHHALARGTAGRTQTWKQVLAEAFDDPVQRRDHIAPEAARVVVVGVQRQPGHRHGRAGGPVGQQGRLAETGRRAHQHQRPAHPLIQPLEQAGPGKPVRAGSREVDLGGQQLVPRTGCGQILRRCRWLSHAITRRPPARVRSAVDSSGASGPPPHSRSAIPPPLCPPSATFHQVLHLRVMSACGPLPTVRPHDNAGATKERRP
jgi:hypothetical protein